MTALEQLEQSIRRDQHVASRALADWLYVRVEAMLRTGMGRDAVYSALNSLYSRHGDRGQTVERDAVAEVLDALDGFCSPESVL